MRNRERSLVPRVRVDVECRFLGPHRGRYLTEIRIIVDNIGKVRRAFEHINIKLRGIKCDQTFERWVERDANRVLFPESLVKADLVPEGDYYYYVEPGVRQTFTYVTDVPQDLAFVLVHIELRPKRDEQESKDETVFTEERVYSIPVAG